MRLLHTTVIASLLVSAGAFAQESPAPPAEAAPEAAPESAPEAAPEAEPAGVAKPPPPAAEPAEPAEEDVLAEAAPLSSGPASAPPADSDRAGGDAKHPGYVIAGAVTLGVGVLSVAGGIWAAADESPETAVGLMGLGTALLGVSVPFMLLGGAADEPEDSMLVVTGTAVATPGIIAVGIGATVMAKREGADKRNDDGVPYILMGAGAAAVVAGVVTWSFGAGQAEHDDGDSEQTVSLNLGLGGAQLVGTF